MSKIILYFDGTSPLYEYDDKYNDLLIKSQITYLQDKYNICKLILVKDVCDIFRIKYDQINLDDLLKYWYKQEPDNHNINIDVTRLDNGTFKLVCITDN